MCKLSGVSPRVPALAYSRGGRNRALAPVVVRRRGVWLLAAAFIFAPGAGAHGDPGCPAEVQRLSAANAELAAQVDELRARVAALQAENDDLKIVAGITPAPGGTAATDDRPPSITDTVEGTTRTLAASGGQLKITRGGRASHWVHFRYEQPAHAPSGTLQTIVMDLRTKFSGGVYSNVKALVFSVDGEDVSCPVTAYRARSLTGGGTRKRIKKDDEFLTVAIPLPAVDRILAGRKVGGRLGPARFAFTVQQLAALRVLRASLDN